MTEEMIRLYKQLNTNEKRNEFSSLLIKIEELVNQALIQNNITSEESNKIKNYDVFEQALETEDEMLLFFYDDLWKIKNKLLMLLVSNSKK